MSENDDSHKGEGNSNQNEQQLPKKPKRIKKFGGKNDPSRSKSAPAETFEDQEEPDNNYIASYNYYLYYNSIKPVDPRLPKPTYTPKPNLEFIRESKKELEEDETPENNPNEKFQVENIANEMDKLNLEANDEINNKNPNLNVPKEDENFENFKKNYSQSQNSTQKLKNNNINQDAPSPLLDYYSFNQSNDLQQRTVENMYQMPPMPNMIPNMKINPINQMYGLNPGFNPYANIPPYGNMMPMQMYNNNVNNRIPNNNMNKKNSKKNIGNKQPDNYDFQNMNQMNMYPGQLYPQSNPMMNMGFNYPQNDPNIKYMPQIAGYNKGGFVPNEASIPMNINIPMNLPINYNMNGVDPYHQQQNMNLGGMYPNPNFGNNTQTKKKPSKDLNKKEIDNKNIDDIIENAVAYSKDHSGSRQIQKKYAEGSEEVKNKIFEKLKPEILNLSKDIFGNYAIQKVLESKDPEKNDAIMEAIRGKSYHGSN